MIKVLEVTESLDCGGRENFAVNILKGINKTKFQVDFFTITSKEQFYTREVISLNAKIFSSETEKVNVGVGVFLRKNLELVRVVRKEKYDVVHIHGDTHLDFLKVLMLKMLTNSKVILHAHGATELNNTVKNKLGRLCRYVSINLTDINIACSKEANKYMFGNKYNVEVIKNPVDLHRFLFDFDMRKSMRNKFGIGDDEFLIGHVGRFSSEKNHIYIIQTFKKFYEMNNNAKLLLVGNGDLRKKIVKYINECNLVEQVIIIDSTNRINDIYCGIDLFWFPSIKESMGMVVIEAQISGTPIIISKGVPKEVIINKNVVQLDYDCEKWIKYSRDLKRIEEIDLRQFMDFSIDRVITRIEKIYSGEV